jgi:antitoxin component YwqK of YwqJK toxin-antitoxin module
MKYIILLLIFIPGILFSQNSFLSKEEAKKINAFIKELSKDQNIEISIISYKGQIDKEGRPYGNWIIYSDTNKSKKLYEGSYTEGMKNGEWLLYDSYGRIKSKELWQDDKLTFWVFYRDPGVKKFEIETMPGITDTTALQIQFLGNASFGLGLAELRTGGSSYEVEQNIVDLLAELIKLSSSNESKLSFWGFKEKLEQERYFINTNEVERITYKYAYGKISEKVIYKNGVLHKKTIPNQSNKELTKIITYFSNGKVSEIGSIKENEDYKIGIWNGYYENGKKKYYGFFKEGEMDGTWKFWNKNGKLEKKEKYKNGVPK